MTVIDVEGLLQGPSGDDLEYDSAFREMELAARGKPEQQFGATIVPAEKPNWREVRRTALDLLGRSKDLRAGVYLARALAVTDGFSGLCDGLALLHGLLDRHWEEMYPHLDPDDGNDPTIRLNVLMALSENAGLVRSVREAALVSVAGLGQATLRDVLIAAGKLPAPTDGSAPPLDTTTLEAIFKACDVALLESTAQAVRRSLGLVRSFESALGERVGAGQSIDLGSLSGVLESAQQVLDERLVQRGVQGAAAVVAPNGAPAGSAAATMAPAAAFGGAIQSREDVVRALTMVCEYFERHEPSSPVSLLVRRAQRLVSKSFLEIMRDVAPDGVSQARMILGDRDESG